MSSLLLHYDLIRSLFTLTIKKYIIQDKCVGISVLGRHKFTLPKLKRLKSVHEQCDLPED